MIERLVPGAAVAVAGSGAGTTESLLFGQVDLSPGNRRRGFQGTHRSEVPAGTATGLIADAQTNA